MSEDSEMTQEEITEFFNNLTRIATVNKIAGKMANRHLNSESLPEESDSVITQKMEEAESIKESFIENAKKEHIRAMSLEEAETVLKEEILAENSNDIYKISARIKNLARTSGAKLTDQGIALCNLYTHVIKSFYVFSDRVTDNKLKNDLVNLIRSHENFPGNVIVSLNPPPIKEKKKRRKKKSITT